MEESGELKSCGDSHLERFAAEIKHLIGHAQPSITGEVPATCWSTNNQDVDIALSVLRAASSSIHDGVTRFNLVFKADPGEAASESMTKEMEGFCQQMVSSLTLQLSGWYSMLLYGMLCPIIPQIEGYGTLGFRVPYGRLLVSVGTSKAMVKYCAAAVRAVLHSLKDLANALLDTTKRSQVNSLTGMVSTLGEPIPGKGRHEVWQACKELQQTPKTNKLACRRQMMQWSVAIKDTIEEFQETAKSAATGNSNGKPDAVAHVVDNAERFGELEASGEGAGDDFDGFDDFGDMDANYSPSELQCVEASVNVLKVFRRCLKVANDALNTLDSSQANRKEGQGDEGLEEGEWLKERLGWAHTLQSCLEDANEGAGELGVLLYPPLSASDLAARVDDLERSLSAFCDAFGSPEDGEGKAGSSCGLSGAVPLRAAVGDKLGALRVELERL